MMCDTREHVASVCLISYGPSLRDLCAHRLQMVVNYLKLGRWMARQGFEVGRRLPDRTAVFDAVAAKVRERDVLYLEFGVYKGASMRYWSKALRHPAAHLDGFDSFDGLPEDFDINGPIVRETFRVDGQVPTIDDPRVRFIKGWFEDTLPSYQVPAHDVLVMCLDADLYSLTRFVLDRVQPWIKRGTFIYFDDMSRPEHEPRAFQEFMAKTGLHFTPVAADRSLNTVFFECLG